MRQEEASRAGDIGCTLAFSGNPGISRDHQGLWACLHNSAGSRTCSIRQKWGNVSWICLWLSLLQCKMFTHTQPLWLNEASRQYCSTATLSTCFSGCIFDSKHLNPLWFIMSIYVLASAQGWEGQLKFLTVCLNSSHKGKDPVFVEKKGPTTRTPAGVCWHQLLQKGRLSHACWVVWTN